MKTIKTPFRNLGIKQSLFVLFAVLSIIQLTAGIFSFMSLVEMGRRYADLESTNLKAVAEITQVESVFFKLRIGRANYDVEDIATRKETIFQGEVEGRQIKEGIQNYLLLIDSQGERDSVKKWQDAYLQYSINRKHFLDRVDSGKTEEAQAYEAQIVPYAAKAVTVLDELISYQIKKAAMNRQRVESYVQNRKTITSLLIFFSALLGGLITWLAVNWISRNQHQKMEVLGKMSALGDIAGSIAHEINNPLTVIQMVSEQIREVSEKELVDQGTIRKLTEKIQGSTSRIGKVISGLKAFSRDGTADPFIAFNVKNMIEETLAFCMDKLKRYSVTFTMYPIPDHLTAEGRATELSQVIVNLMSNAIDAIEKLNEKWIKFSISDLGESIEISIIDSGGGIPKSIREKMFKTSFTTKPLGVGTGLGLGICWKIVDAHHGSIFVDEKCKNTRFVIRLPKIQTVSQPQTS